MKASAYFTLGDGTAMPAVGELKRALDAHGGVTGVSVSRDRHSVAVDYDTTAHTSQTIGRALNALGYDARCVRVDSHAT